MGHSPWATGCVSKRRTRLTAPGARGLTAGSWTAGAGVFGELEDLADDQVARVVDEVAVQLEDLAGAAGVAQRVAGDRPQRVVRADLVDRPGDGVRGRTSGSASRSSADALATGSLRGAASASSVAASETGRLSSTSDRPDRRTGTPAGGPGRPAAHRVRIRVRRRPRRTRGQVSPARARRATRAGRCRPGRGPRGAGSGSRAHVELVDRLTLAELYFQRAW